MRCTIVLLFLAAAAGAADAPYAAHKPLPVPELFAPGVISTGDFDSHPAFTPDGNTLVFLKSSANFSYWTIVESHYRNGAWTTPVLAPWAGRWRDADPFITADGRRLWFISDRPVNDKPKEDLDIWYVDRRGDSWTEPVHLEGPVNTDADEWFPTLASDGTMYFGSSREGGAGKTDLYRSRLVDGKYTAPENLRDAINSKSDEFEPMIAPDQSFLIFMASGRPEGKGGGDFYISEFREGKWQPAHNLGEPINSRTLEISPKISPDGKWLFFTSSRGVFSGKPFDKMLTTDEMIKTFRGPKNGLGDIYQVDMSAVRGQ
jgi:Tol biopolymer transport system component